MSSGGCACGAIRYRIVDEKLDDCGYCHCRVCQKTCGAPVMVFATVAMRSFVLDGDAKRYRSTSFGERWFCPACGTQIAMRVDHEPDTIDVAVATLDEPDGVSPGFHIWVSSRIRWLEIADDLPRWPGDREGVS